ncbi:MAG: transposase [Bacteroidetes bacterium]|nr:transposase [Bacteroidota bacterium]
MQKKSQEGLLFIKKYSWGWGYLSSVVLAEVGDLRRFNKETQFASFVGVGSKYSKFRDD